MARGKRICIAGVPQHVVQRGNNKQPCFLADKDRHLYLKLLAEYAEKYNVKLHAYVLMTNHVHLLLTPLEDGATSLLMQAVGRSYVRYFNTEHKRSGTLWEGRFKSSLIDTDRYFLAVSRYIEMNPVRAAMVKTAEEYFWSSYRLNSAGKKSSLLSAHPVYLALATSDEKRALAYRQLFDTPQTSAELKEIRTALKKSWLLGSTAFSNKLSKQLGEKLCRFSHGGSRRRRTTSSDLTP